MARYSVSLTDPRHVAWLNSQAGPSKAVQALIDRHLTGPGRGNVVDLSAIRAIFETVLDERGLSSLPAQQSTILEDPLGAFDDLAE